MRLLIPKDDGGQTTEPLGVLSLYQVTACNNASEPIFRRVDSLIPNPFQTRFLINIANVSFVVR